VEAALYAGTITETRGSGIHALALEREARCRP
jgi:hypothetical protein